MQELLHSHLNRFEPDKQAFDENQNKLRDNWRSDRRIVQFNNEFFTFASHYFLQNEPENPSMQKIQEIYSDVCQEISEQRVCQAYLLLHKNEKHSVVIRNLELGS